MNGQKRFISPAFWNPSQKKNLYLLPNLPLRLLGGKPLLESFGFLFPDRIPNVLKHPEELEMDMELEFEPTFKPICYYNDSRKMYLCCKQSNNGI